MQSQSQDVDSLCDIIPLTEIKEWNPLHKFGVNSSQVSRVDNAKQNDK